MDLLLYFLCFLVLWKSSDLIVSSVSKLAHHLRISTFSVSFFILGMLTDLPEATVGITSVANKTPQIFIGNMLGGILALFIFIIPTLAVLGGGISLRHELTKKQLIITLLAIISPAIMFLIGRVYFWEGFILIGIYFLLFYLLEKDQIVKAAAGNKFHWGKDIFKIIIGIIFILGSSHYLVQKTIEMSNFLRVSPFIISFILMGIGTNLPELALSFDAILNHKKEVAFGDILGSAVSYLFIMGVLIVVNWTGVSIPENFNIQFIFIIAGILMFYIFARSKNGISRYEGLTLLGLYVIFLIVTIYGNILI